MGGSGALKPPFFLACGSGFLFPAEGALFSDPGVFWHTRVGQEILSSGQLPLSDHLSFTCAGKPWAASQWLGECALALLHDLSGLDGILLGTATLLACFYTWLVRRLLRMGIEWSIALFTVVLAIAASSYHFHPRPHLLTLVLLGYTFARLCDCEAGRIPLRRLWWLVPVFVIWSNAHGGVIGGVATLSVTIVGWGLWKILGRSSPLASYRQLIPLCCLVLCCGLTTLVNPYGWEVPRIWFSLIRSPVIPQIMEEHRSLAQTPAAWTVLLLAALYVFALVGMMPRWPPVTWLTPIAWFYLASANVRHGPLFATTAAVALAEILPHVRWVVWISGGEPELFPTPPEKSGAARKKLAWTWRCYLPLSSQGHASCRHPVGRSRSWGMVGQSSTPRAGRSIYYRSLSNTSKAIPQAPPFSTKCFSEVS